MTMLKEPKQTKAKLKRHSKFVASLDICAAEHLHEVQCDSAIQSCHVRHGFYCMGKKPTKREVPMCSNHHTRQHSIGEEKFWGEFLEDAILLGEELWEISGDYEGGQWLVTNFVRNT